MKKQIVIVSAALIASAAAGGGIGYFVASKQLKGKYEDLANLEIAQARDFFSAQYKKGDYSTPGQVLGEEEGVQEPTEAEIEAVEAMAVYQGHKVNVVTPKNDLLKPEFNSRPVDQPDVEPEDEREEKDEGPTQNNIFLNGAPIDQDDYDPENDGFVMADEIAAREDKVQYVLSTDEYEANDEDYVQGTLTYFEFDNKLIDEGESLLDIEATVGSENLRRFGAGSGNPDCVYVANEATHQSWEIYRSTGSYDEEVNGIIDDTLSHSDDYTFEKNRRRVVFEE